MTTKTKTKTKWIISPPNWRLGWFTGFGAGLFLLCVPLKDLVATNLPRLAVGTIGLGLMSYGTISLHRNPPKPAAEGDAVVTTTTPSNL